MGQGKDFLPRRHSPGKVCCVSLCVCMGVQAIHIADCVVGKRFSNWESLGAMPLSSVLIPTQESANLEALVVAAHLQLVGIRTVADWNLKRMTPEVNDKVRAVVDKGRGCVVFS